jgi:UDP-galactopyranose mutase
MKFDYLIVGAGFSGLVMAERLATQMGKTSLIVEKRRHIGGNCYDRYDDYGVLIHQYGPHYFRTNSSLVKNYLSQFTAWNPVDYTIKSFSDGRYWSFPVNLNTFEELIGRPATTPEFEAWLAVQRVSIENPRNSEDVIVSQVGWDLYNKFFLGYTLKQWKRHPRDLDSSVCGRIPIRTNRDDRYLREEFQALPSAGYTAMFDRMIAACGNNVRILLNTDYREVMPHFDFGHIIYTGPIDDYFDCCYGALPYRSLKFEAESFDAEQLKERYSISGKCGFWQPAVQVKYPNDHDFTRIVEVKHATGQKCLNSTIVREFPADYKAGMEAYYPIPANDASALYEKYADRAALTPGVSFIGRLATYKYYNMDQIVAIALKKFDQIKGVGNF